MADPTSYNRTFSFTDFQAGNPSKPLPGVQVDNELENVEQSLGEAIDAIKDVRRSDGALVNGIVTTDSLDPTVKAGVGTGALASAAAAAASADAASDSAVAAAASATAADTSKTAAAGSASAAMTYRNEASGSADDAQAMAVSAATARDYAAAWASAAGGVDVDDGVNPVSKSSYHWAQVALGAATGALPDGSVSTTKIVDEAVTLAKLATEVTDEIDAAAAAAVAGLNIKNVSDRAALKALDTNATTLAFLAEVGREGPFKWTPGDFSAQIAADTREAIFIKSDGVAASAGAWVRQYDVVLSSWFGDAADGVADDTAALAAIATLSPYLIGGVVHLRRGGTYLVDQWDLGAAANLKISSNGSVFVERTGSASATPFMTLGAGVGLDFLGYSLPAGKTRRNVVQLAGTGAKLREWNIASVNQVNNVTTAVSDAALIVTGALCSLGVGIIDGFDSPYRWAGADTTVKYAQCTRYVRGHWFDATQRGWYQRLEAKIASVNAKVDPGDNGVLFTDPVGCGIGLIVVFDAGEHGVRFGGQTTGAIGISIDIMRIHNSGGCGLKVRTGDAFVRNTDIQIGAAIISDSGTGAVAGDWGPNEEGILLERADNVEISFARVFKQNKLVSCARGIRINSSTGIRIPDCSIEDCEDQGIFLENTDDNGVTFRNLTDVYIKGIIKNAGSHAVYAVYSSATFRNIQIDVNARNIGGDGFNVVNSGGMLASACVFKGDLIAVTGAAVAGTAAIVANPNLKFLYTLDGVPTNHTPGTSTSGILLDYRSNVGGAGARVGVVRTDGDLENVNNSYTALSDRRIKADIQDAGPQWDDIKALKVRSFTNLLNGGRHIGLVADEAKAVSPGLIKALEADETLQWLRQAHPDASEDEIAALAAAGPIELVKYSLLALKMLPVVQELQARVEELEAARSN